jgi:hypothetical protein
MTTNYLSPGRFPEDGIHGKDKEFEQDCQYQTLVIHELVERRQGGKSYFAQDVTSHRPRYLRFRNICDYLVLRFYVNNASATRASDGADIVQRLAQTRNVIH